MGAKRAALDAKWTKSSEQVCSILERALLEGNIEAVHFKEIEALPEGVLSALHVRDVCALATQSNNVRLAVHRWVFFLLGGTSSGLQHPASCKQGNDNALAKALQVRHCHRIPPHTQPPLIPHHSCV